jgi:hypothetical protein
MDYFRRGNVYILTLIIFNSSFITKLVGHYLYIMYSIGSGSGSDSGSDSELFEPMDNINYMILKSIIREHFFYGCSK